MAQTSNLNKNNWTHWYKNATKNDWMDSYKEDGFMQKPTEMSDKDYDVGKNYWQAYLAEDKVNTDYQNNTTALDNNAIVASKGSEIAYQKLMKYLPSINNQNGINNMGMAASTYIDADNNYRNQLNSIAAEKTTQLSNLYSAYTGNVQDLQANAMQNEQTIKDNYYNKDAIDEQKKTTQQKEYENTKNSVLANINNKVAADKDGKYSARDKSWIKAYLDVNKESLGTEYDKLKVYLDSVYDIDNGGAPGGGTSGGGTPGGGTSGGGYGGGGGGVRGDSNTSVGTGAQIIKTTVPDGTYRDDTVYVVPKNDVIKSNFQGMPRDLFQNVVITYGKDNNGKNLNCEISFSEPKGTATKKESSATSKYLWSVLKVDDFAVWDNYFYYKTIDKNGTEAIYSCWPAVGNKENYKDMIAKISGGN